VRYQSTGESSRLRLAIRLFRTLPHANCCVIRISPWTGALCFPLTVLAQDPSVLRNGKALTISVLVPAESLAPGPKSHRIHVVDYDSTENRY